jgi:uncharacterized protein
MPLLVTPVPGGVRFAVRVQPRSSRPGIDGVHGEALRVRVGAAPVDGAANEAVVALLAEALGVPRRSVRIVRGDTARSKLVEVLGASPEQATTLAIRSSG